MIHAVRLLFVCGIGVIAAAAHAEEPTKLEKGQVFGDRELPNVMYVLPWKRPELGELVSKPAKSLLDESLAPLDREVFRREIHYFESLHQ